jgi:SprT protein
MTELQEKAIAVVHKYIDKANEIWGLNLSYPLVTFKKEGRTAGTFNPATKVIDLNNQLLEQNGQVFLDRTPGHEVGHLVTDALYGRLRTYSGRRSVHGREWKSVMVRMGLSPNRCHTYDTSNLSSSGKRGRPAGSRMKRPFVYTCGCQEFHLTQILHRRMLAGQSRYCKKCRGTLTFKGIEA